jgi:hypothetical protein
MLGYYYVPKSSIPEALFKTEKDGTKKSILDSTAPSKKIKISLQYSKGDINPKEIEYPILQCLYYDDNNYYHYAYTPTYKEYKQEKLKDGVTYYYKTDEGTYRVANPAARKYTDADHNERTL